MNEKEKVILERFEHAKRNGSNANGFGTALFLLGIRNKEMYIPPLEFRNFEDRFEEVKTFEECDLIYDKFLLDGYFGIRHPIEWAIIHRPGDQVPVFLEPFDVVMEKFRSLYPNFKESELTFYKLKEAIS